jgi:hypothetical protein
MNYKADKVNKTKYFLNISSNMTYIINTFYSLGIFHKKEIRLFLKDKFSFYYLN